MPVALTRANLEQIMVGPDGRSGMAGKLAVLVGLYDPDVPGFAVGSLPCLNEPIAGALRQVGAVLDNPVLPSSADIATIPAGRIDQFLDRAKLRLMEHCLSNWDIPDEQAGTDARQDWGKLFNVHRTALADWRAHVLTTWGPPASAPSGVGSISAGVVDLGSAEPDCLYFTRDYWS